jgi:peptidoglycan/xylan/chitin deacetylase (PgdA/CDA1 family)
MIRAVRMVGLAMVVAALCVAAPAGRGAALDFAQARKAPRHIQLVPRHTLYLTFDADMTPAMLRRLHGGEVSSWYDPAILQFLQENHVPAAIFVSGLFAEAYPDLIDRLAHDPLFVIGVHGYRHAAFTPHCYGLPSLRTDADKLDDITRARDTIARLTGRTPMLFRYPGLCHDSHDDALVRQAGLAVDTPSVIAGDSFNHDVEAIARQVLRQARDGGTVIFHLGGPNAPVTLDALEKVVPALKRKGYEFGCLRASRDTAAPAPASPAASSAGRESPRSPCRAADPHRRTPLPDRCPRRYPVRRLRPR